MIYIKYNSTDANFNFALVPRAKIRKSMRAFIAAERR